MEMLLMFTYDDILIVDIFAIFLAKKFLTTDVRYGRRKLPSNNHAYLLPARVDYGSNLLSISVKYAKRSLTYEEYAQFSPNGDKIRHKFLRTVATFSPNIM